MTRHHALFSPQPDGTQGDSFPGAFDDEPIPLDDADPTGPQVVPVHKVPNHLRPRDPQPVPVPRPVAPAGDQPAPEAVPKIRAFEQRVAGKHEDKGWSRAPNCPGTGAIHVRSFHCKLNTESMEFLDQQINEWLDSHPQYEVKFVTTGVGDWTGKVKEPNLVVQVWV